MRADRRFDMTDKRIVLTTAASEEEADKIARHLVEHRLAACVNKTTAAAFGQVRHAIAELHSYDVPECICLTIEDGSPTYLEWVAESVSTGE
jgi:periplasmic divalent cation tolerance protein